MNHPEAVFMVLLGLFSIVCSYMNFEFFMNNYKTKFLLSLIGRNGTRAFYFALGLLLLGLGVHTWR